MAAGYDVVTCCQCGFVYADTDATQKDYDRFYGEVPKYADANTSTGSGASQWDAQRLKATAQTISGVFPNRAAALLDMGCGAGGLLRALGELGYHNLWGVDPSAICVETCNRIPGVHALRGLLTDLDVGAQRFDLIILCHVLEHVRDIPASMVAVREALRPDGRVYVETPDASRYAQFLESPFQDFNTEHINHFSEFHLKSLLRATGFEPVLAGEKTIHAGPTALYPAVFTVGKVASPGPARPAHIRDTSLRSRILDYIAASDALLRDLDQQIAAGLDSSRQVIVWGTGQLAMKLLNERALRNATVTAFVDGNPVNHGRMLAGIAIQAPESLRTSGVPILVASTLHSGEIAATIRSIGLKNPLIELVNHEHERTTKPESC